MKTFKFLIPAALIAFSSCEKELKVDAAPDFDVSLASNTVKAGQPIQFSVSGYADQISFYSGEVYRDYEFRDGRTVDLPYKGATLTFNTGVNLGTQANQLRVLISNNFNGDYSSLSSVKAATWVDITDSLKLATNATFISAGTLDISRYSEGGRPFHVAFKYLTRPQLENGVVRTWMIENFRVSSIDKFNGANLLFKDQAFAAFTVVDEDPENNPSRSSITTTRLTLQGNTFEDPASPKYNPENPIYDPANPIYDPKSEFYDPNAVRPEFKPYDTTNPYNDPQRETWAVSSAIEAKAIEMGPDLPIGIRGIRNPKLEEYAYTYNTPGTYQAVFVAKNSTINESKEVIRKVSITVTP
jgi:hypothetical protein